MGPYHASPVTKNQLTDFINPTQLTTLDQPIIYIGTNSGEIRSNSVQRQVQLVFYQTDRKSVKIMDKHSGSGLKFYPTKHNESIINDKLVLENILESLLKCL